MFELIECSLIAIYIAVLLSSLLMIVKVCNSKLLLLLSFDSCCLSFRSIIASCCSDDYVRSLCPSSRCLFCSSTAPTGHPFLWEAEFIDVNMNATRSLKIATGTKPRRFCTLCFARLSRGMRREDGGRSLVIYNTKHRSTSVERHCLDAYVLAYVVYMLHVSACL